MKSDQTLLRGLLKNVIPIMNMRISCPNCSTEYEVPDAALAGRSRKVRCERCGSLWRHMEPGAPAWPEDRSKLVAMPEQDFAEPIAPVELSPWPKELNVFPQVEPRRFGRPVDEAAQAEIIQAVGQEEKGQPASAEVPLPAEEPVTARETNTDEALLRFVTEARHSDMAPAREPGAEPANKDKFAELIYAARNKSVEYEPDPLPRPSPVRTSNSPLFALLLVLLIIAFVLLEHRNIVHYIPASARFFAALGLK